VRCDVSDSLISEDWCAALVNYQRLFVGFSGGLDSTVLLHSLSRQPVLASKLQAVHVNHGLSPNADAWQSHCQKRCETLSIPFLPREVQVDPLANIEEGARLARYAVFSSLLTENDCLLLGHHIDDQAETLLLQLFRGAGVDGMAAMAPIKRLTKGVLARPLLQYSRVELEGYARQHQLTWVDDESNQNSAFSRNYLRHQIMPLLQEKWPSVVDNLARSATHCQQAKLNLEALAEIDCVELIESSDRLSLRHLLTLNHERLVNVLRVWLRRNQVRYPSAVILKRIINEVIFAKNDASTMIEWNSITVRRYQQTLYLLKVARQDQPTTIEWAEFPAPLRLGEEVFLVSLRPAACPRDPEGFSPGEISGSRGKAAGRRQHDIPTGLKIPPGSHVQVRFRQGGELLHWHGQTKQLKKLFQQWQVPPWQRDQTPLLYINDELAAVVGYAISDQYCGTDPANTYHIELHPTNTVK